MSSTHWQRRKRALSSCSIEPSQKKRGRSPGPPRACEKQKARGDISLGFRFAAGGQATLPSAATFPRPRLFPFFPCVSTNKSARPQFSHSPCRVFYCSKIRNARHCNHCRRGHHAASDRARLVLRQFARASCRAVPKACKRCGQPGRCGLLRNGLAWRDC